MGTANKQRVTIASPVEISGDDLIDAVTKAPGAYLDEHEADSLTTIAALVLLRKTESDLRESPPESERGFTRSDFLEKVKHAFLDKHGTEPNDESLKSCGQAVASQMAKFRPKVSIHGIHCQVWYSGPTKAHRGGEGSDRYYLVPNVEPADEATLTFAHLVARCFCCPAPSVRVFDPNDRYCDERNCYGRHFAAAEQKNYVTILPEPRPSEGVRTPLPLETQLVRFAVPENELRPEVETDTPSHQPILPFEVDYLSDLGLSLGTPIIYEAPQFEAFSGFRKVFVLDMSTYRPTGTLKDPKSWAVLNCAIQAGVNHLIAYTAGNAALSLAKLAYEVNRMTGKRITVYALVGSDISDNIRSVLSASGCKILPVALPSGALPIVDRSNIWSYLHCHLDGTSSDVPLSDAWNVTDGHDGVGICMYRAIFGEVFRRLQPKFVVVPAGTGNLLVGASLALSNLEDSATARKPQLIAAVPYPENIKQACYEQKMPYDRRFRLVSEDDAVMPKLTGAYSPLIPCVSYLHKTGRVHFIEVSAAMQLAAAQWMAQLPHGLRINAEPSALAGFGALAGGDDRFPGLREYARDQEAPSDYRSLPSSSSTVLVVNTGFGVVGARDYTFLAKAGL